MSDLLDDSDLLSEDYKKSQKDDDLDDDLDDELLYSSDEEKDDFSYSSLDIDEPVDLKSEEPKQNFLNTTSLDQVVQVQVAPQVSSTADNSDSEGTDTRDETDDFPLNGDNASRNKIKIYRTISNVSSEKAATADEISAKESVSTTPENVTIISNDFDDSMVDEDDESDNDEKSERGRFKSERDVKTVTISSRRRRNSEQPDIPDTLEISKEDQEKIEEFDKQQKVRRSNKRQRGFGNRRGFSPQNRMGQGMRRTPRFPNFQGLRIPRPPPFSQMPGGNQPRGPSLLGEPPSLGPLFPRQPPPFAMHMPPPPQWMGLRNIPPPTLPGQPVPQLVAPSTLQPPAVPVQAAIPPSSIPVLAATSRDATIEAAPASETNQGNPIPTVMSQGKRADNEISQPSKSKSKREAIFEDKGRDSPRLSVKFNRSRSRSRSPSPVPRNSKRLVLKPRRSRSPKSRSSRRRDKSPKKRRRRSRSYSPRRRSRSRSRSYSPRKRSPSPRRKTAAAKPGKILINPHFKGNRNIPSSATLPKSTPTTSATPAAATAPIINPLLYSIPPPPLPVPAKVTSLPQAPPVNLNVPPPQIATTLAAALPKVPPPLNVPPPTIPPGVPAAGTTPLNRPPPPITSIPPPALPNNSGLSNPAVRAAPQPFTPNVPPPALLPLNQASSVIARPPGVDITRPPPLLPPNTSNPPPNISPSQKPPRFSTGSRPRFQPRNSGPVAHVRPVRDVRPQADARFPQARFSYGQGNAANQTRMRYDQRNAAPGKEAVTGNNIRSRLKPPPTSTLKTNQSQDQQNWKREFTDNADYQEKMRQQEEKRKEILALKARRRGGKVKNDDDTIVATIRSTAPVIRSVKISNMASATKLHSIEKIMKSIGPIDNLQYNQNERCVFGTFKSAQHAKEFAEKYNRYMLDLSYITISLNG